LAGSNAGSSGEQHRAAGPGWRRAVLVIGIATGLLAAGFCAGFARYVSSLDRAERDPDAKADGIVALTGGAHRIEDAIALLGRGFGTRLLITGVGARTSREEIARLSPGLRDLVECCVDLDYRARDTIGNAFETGRWAREKGFRSLIVVTSNYHMPRTLAELNHALPETRKVPHAVTGALDPAEWWTKPGTARLLLSEYVKYLAVLLRTWWTPPGLAPAPDPSRIGMVALPEAPL
jgi:uncharacterized SAM-binding protein YcdF (DUF218 family)